MKKEYKTLWFSIKKVVQEIDPENLMDVAPDDEYDDYVSAIVSKIINNDFELESIKNIFPAVSMEKREVLFKKIEQIKTIK